MSFELECEKNENKQKEAGIGPFLSSLMDQATSHVTCNNQSECFIASIP